MGDDTRRWRCDDVLGDDSDDDVDDDDDDE